MISSKKLHKELKVEISYVAWSAIYALTDNGVSLLTQNRRAIKDIYINEDFAKYVIGNSITYDKEEYMKKLLKKVTINKG